MFDEFKVYQRGGVSQNTTCNTPKSKKGCTTTCVAFSLFLSRVLLFFSKRPFDFIKILFHLSSFQSFVIVVVVCCLQKRKKRKKKGKKRKKNTSSHTTQNRTEVSRFSLVIVSLCSTRRRTCRDTNRTEHPQHKQIRSTATRVQRCKRRWSFRNETSTFPNRRSRARRTIDDARLRRR